MLVLENFILLFVETAPYLLLGMFLAGVIHQLVPRNWIEATLGKQSSVVTAAIIGAPLPLCSCSVIPVAMGIRRSGASKASTASFLVATPETGVDSIGITYALMGWVMAVARPIAAIFSAIVTGFAILLFGSRTAIAPSSSSEQQAASIPPTSDSCCAKEKPKPVAACCSTKAPIKKSCCDSSPEPIEAKAAQNDAVSMMVKLKQAVVYGFDTILADFVFWLLIGLGFAALIVTFVPANWMASYGSGPLAMLLMVLVSIPMYICATASTPIAVGLMLAGISPGAALVFMLTGPATNIATLMVIKNELGTRELVIYLAALISSALLCGWLLDIVVKHYQLSIQLSHGEHSDTLSLLYQASAVVLAGLIAYQVLKKLKPRLPARGSFSQ